MYHQTLFYAYKLPEQDIGPQVKSDVNMVIGKSKDQSSNILNCKSVQNYLLYKIFEDSTIVNAVGALTYNHSHEIYQYL